MAYGYPDSVHFTGTNLPIRAEFSVRDLPVEGELPADLEGAFFRAVPDPAHPPMFADDIVLSGDGMVSKFEFTDGHVDFAIKYVETERYTLEREARRALFGKYRNPFTDDPSVEGKDRTVANTTPVWHAGRLFMTKEDGRAYEINPETLETVGRWDYYGALKSQTMTAHPRVDAETGEMFFFGYEAGGLCTLDVAYCIADKDGNLKSEEWFQQPYCSTIHDFVITKNWAVFPIYPTTADLDRLKAGGEHWAHIQDEDSWVGFLPRYGKADEIKWIKGPKGVSAFHFVNAFEKDGKVHVDICLSETNAFGFMREAGGIHIPQPEVKGALTRWSFDPANPDAGLEERPLGPPGDLPRVRDVDQGREYDVVWYPSMNPQGGPPLPGGPVGANFNALLRLEPATGRIDMLPLGPGMAFSEPAHVPAKDGSHGGWLLTVVDTQTGENAHSSELWVVKADDFAAGPVAKVHMPIQLRSQVHGCWVSRDRLDDAAVLKD